MRTPLHLWATIILLSFFFSTESYSQMSNADVAGEYDLRGVMEVGSGIVLNADGTFLFFFSYGALDKQGTGTYEITGKKIILNSRPRPSSDFSLVKSSERGNRITVKITDPNKYLLKDNVCQVMSAGQIETVETDEEGVAEFKMKSVDTIGIVHHMLSDRLSIFVPSNKTDNYFEFRIDPCILEIFCDHLVLEWKDGELRGPHPLLEEGKDYVFVKG